jgi:hypothetical protein
MSSTTESNIIKILSRLDVPGNAAKIYFILSEKINEDVLLKLPQVCGVAFVKSKYFKLGIVIAHEGYIIDKTNLIHASSENNKTVNVDFLSYLFNDGEPRFDGVMFYRINPS